MNVPFLDLAAQDREVGREVQAAVAEVLASHAFVLGPHVERFEAAMAAYCGVPHAIGVASGTDALLLSLGGLGVGPGVSVLTTPFSFWATASTIVRLGATPLFADVDPVTFNLDPSKANKWKRLSGRIYGVDLNNGYSMFMVATSSRSHYDALPSLRMKLVKSYLAKTQDHILGWLKTL